MHNLPRLKPDPIPRIQPVPEYAATGSLKHVYEKTKAGFGVPWMGVVAMAFAYYPRFYDTLWSALAPIVGSAAFDDACIELRAFAEREAAALSPPNILGRLTDMGYQDREIEELRACNEIFSVGNMPYLLMASLARLLLEGGVWQNGSPPGNVLKRRPGVAKPVLIEPHHADPMIAALYDDIRQTLDLPFVNTDYRAFARWPSYFAPAWKDLKSAVQSAAYERHVTHMHDRAATLAAGLPNVTGLTPLRLIEAAEKDASAEKVRSVVRLFQWLLPGLAINVAFLRCALNADHYAEQQVIVSNTT